MTRKFRRTNRRSIFAEFRVEFRAEVDGVVKRAVGDVESGIELGIDGFWGGFVRGDLGFPAPFSGVRSIIVLFPYRHLHVPIVLHCDWSAGGCARALRLAIARRKRKPRPKRRRKDGKRVIAKSHTTKGSVR